MAPTRTDLEALAVARFGALRFTERLVMHAWAAGDIARIGLVQPEAWTGEASVRGAFLAFLLGGGLPLPRRGLQLLGAYVEGRLDLAGCRTDGPLWFYRCRFDSTLRLDRARIGGDLSLAGSRLPRVAASGCTIAGDLVLDAGCRIDEELRLVRTRVGGRLDAARLDLGSAAETNPIQCALHADGLEVAGEVHLTDGCSVLGEARFVGARIGGDWVATGHFTGTLAPGGRRQTALVLDRIEVGGKLRFGRGFGAAGRVSLRRAQIGGDLDASGADFDRQGDAAWTDGSSLVLDRASIGGALVLTELASPITGASFVDARAGSLVDDRSTWGQRLVLDGFAYGRLGDEAPLDTRFRLDWLERQPPEHLREQFRAQPWRRLIKVLRRMGHDRHAGSIALTRERKLRQAGRVGDWAPPALRWLPRAGHWLVELVAGHGHRPGRALLAAALVWIAGTAAYWAAADTSAAGPLAQGTSAALHSLDRLLPFAGFGPASGWSASSAWAEAMRWLARVQTGLGWTIVGLFVASIAGWLDRDRRA